MRPRYAGHGGRRARPSRSELLARAGAAVFDGKQLAAGLRLLQPLLQPAKRGTQRFGLGTLVAELLGKTSHLLMADLLPERGTSKIVLLASDGERCLTLPVAGGLLMLRLLLFEKVLVGERDGHLRLYLQKLVLHIQDELTQHLLRIFRAVDHIVQVGAKQSLFSNAMA